MRYIGLHMGHDAAIAEFNEAGDLVFYAPCERYSPRLKMHGTTMSPSLFAFPNFSISNEDCVSIVRLNNEKIQRIDEYESLLVQECLSSINFGNFGFDPKFVIDHHFCHAICSWCFRPDDNERMFLTYDGSGPSLIGSQKASLAGIINSNGARSLKHNPIPSSVCLFNLLGDNSAGKAMGMAGFRPNAPNFINDDFVSELLKNCMNWKLGEISCPRVNIKSEKDMDFVASFYNFVIEDIWNHVKENVLNLSEGRGIVVGGGTTLALELNTRLFDLVGDVVFAPPTNDTGLAIGAAAFSYFHHHKKWPKLNNASLVSLDETIEGRGPQTPFGVAEMISQGKIVGLLRGKGEAGPRALGFRSILADARDIKNLHLVSEKIKGREFYRPLAPMVTSEQFDRFFIGPKGMYMQYRVQCTDEAKKQIPAIVHVDNSSRPQVVFRENDPWLHEMLVCYGKLTGHECMINTSLNKAGKPICNTYKDAQEDFPTGLELVCISCEKTIIELTKRGVASNSIPFHLQFGNQKML